MYRYFLDIAKAFDTVSIPILLKKLELIGIRGLQHQLFTDYLSNRQQRIKIGSFVSDPLPMVFGVPQGSILGPTLFLIYINGLCSLKLRNCKIVTFADDTALLFQGESWDQTHEFAQSGFDAVSNWLRGNSLSLNSDKTKYICFSISSIDRPINALMSHSSLCLSNGIPNNCSCIDLQCVSSIKYLGIIIDNRLTFKEHIDLLSRRIRKLIAIFKNLRYVAEGKLLKTIYFALCQSLLQYCIGSWGGAAKTTMLVLERAQRAVLKTATGRPFRYPTEELFKNCQVLTVRQLFIKQIIMNKHKTSTFDGESYLSQRRKDKIFPTISCNTEFAYRFPFYLDSVLYNRISKFIEIYPLSLQECKIKLTSWLQTLNYNKTEELLLTVK
ncbi:hypothetical protein JYU34_004798 [Plutella xylostella]|uniref:Reverse transcriptase domain-containing protein n=1 Tax=Plutella xylostella TaxID=51655 RepID=A0ABQ7QYV2_PLUXY|nr:hypothetical protein JYU34_004798 [Plutella xylostella]